EPDEAAEPEQTDAEADLDDLARLDATAPAAPAEETETPPPPDLTPKPVVDAETVERVSRYNFDELSRILNDRVGDATPPARPATEPSRGGALINLGG